MEVFIYIVCYKIYILSSENSSLTQVIFKFNKLNINLIFITMNNIINNIDNLPAPLGRTIINILIRFT